MIDTNQKEVWMVYPDYPWIEVSNLGRVRTKDRYVPCMNGGKRLVKGRVLKQRPNNKGYMLITFHANGKLVHLLVHRMVATCYNPNPNSYPEVNHIDNDRKNNSASNLEWCTHEFNIAYKNNFGTSPAEVSGQPIIAIDPEISKVLWFKTQAEASRQLSISHSSISWVVNGKRNTAGGFWFCRADENAVEKTRVKFGDKIAEKVKELIGENYD